MSAPPATITGLAGGAYIAFHVCAPPSRATSLSMLLALACLRFLTVADIKGNVGATRRVRNTPFSKETCRPVTTLVTVSFPFDDELKHGNPGRKGPAKQPEDGRWSNDNRLPGENSTIAGSPLPVDD